VAYDGAGFPGKDVAQIKGAPDRIIKLYMYQAKAGMLGEQNKEPVDM
jgi:hypothetical protein